MSTAHNNVFVKKRRPLFGSKKRRRAFSIVIINKNNIKNRLVRNHFLPSLIYIKSSFFDGVATISILSLFFSTAYPMPHMVPRASKLLINKLNETMDSEFCPPIFITISLNKAYMIIPTVPDRIAINELCFPPGLLKNCFALKS